MGVLSNGSSQAKQREQAAERDFDRSLHQGNLAEMGPGRGVPDHFDELVEAGVPEETVYQLQHLLSKDVVLANLKDAEVHEARWIARGLHEALLRMHPDGDSVFTGEYRRFVLDRPNQGLQQLDDQMKLTIWQFIFNYTKRLSRARGGWQQEEMTKQTKVSVTKSEKEEDKGWSF